MDEILHANKLEERERIFKWTAMCWPIQPAIITLNLIWSLANTQPHCPLWPSLLFLLSDKLALQVTNQFQTPWLANSIALAASSLLCYLFCWRPANLLSICWNISHTRGPIWWSCCPLPPAPTSWPQQPPPLPLLFSHMFRSYLSCDIFLTQRDSDPVRPWSLNGDNVPGSWNVASTNRPLSLWLWFKIWKT
jgi:hypothetical protein